MADADATVTDATLEKLKPLLKPDKLGEARVVLTRTMSKIHSGPIPSAEEMEHLEQIHPGAADRCFGMAEREQAHRHECEKMVISKEFTFRDRGQWMAISAVIVLLAAVAYIATLGDTRAAAGLGTATLVGLVYAFTVSKRIESRASEPEKTDVPAKAPSKSNAGKTTKAQTKRS